MSTAKLSPLAALQIFHLGLLLFAAVLCGTYYYLTDAQDFFRSRFDMLVIASGAVVPVAVFLYSVIFGEAESLRKKLVDTYRKLLLSKPFLWITNVTLSAVCAVLAHLIVQYRNVTIVVNENANLYLNDVVGSVDSLGEWKGGQSRTIRMRVGQHSLVAKDQITGGLTAALQIDVKSPWRSCSCDFVSVNILRDRFHTIK
jgi:hypothetical protein